MNVEKLKELSVDRLRKNYDPRTLPELKEIEPFRFLGQERARQALEFGLGIDAEEFNIFLSGPAETGKTTLVKELLSTAAQEFREKPRDWCYVQDFGKKYATWISFPCGEGKKFKRAIRDVVIHLLDALKVEQKLMGKAGEREKQLRNDFNRKAKEHGLWAGYLNVGGIMKFNLWCEMTKGTYGDRDFIDSEKSGLPKEEKEKILEKFALFEESFKELSGKIKDLDKKIKGFFEDSEKRRKFKEEKIIRPVFEKLRAKYGDNKRAVVFLKDMEADVKENVELFDLSAEVELFKNGVCMGCNHHTTERCPIHGPAGVFVKYEVNVLVDNSEIQGAPVVIKNIATYHELFGKINSEFLFPGGSRSDHSMIVPGALHEANGGFLILKANDLLAQPLFLPLWRCLVHTQKSGVIKIESIPSITGFEYNFGTSFRAEPIPLKVRIVLIGSEFHYHFLLANDQTLDFTRVFKVKAQMEPDTPASEKNIRQILGFIKHYCQKEKLLFPAKPVLARMLEFSSEVAGDQEKLTLELVEIKSLLKESSYYAKQNEREVIGLEDIDKALSARKKRLSFYEEKIQEAIKGEILNIPVSGKKIGQINGLAVLSLGDYQFGRPSRVTATLSLGKEGVVSIDREVEMSGPIHGKGVIILTSYLQQIYGNDCPLSFNAAICFEQSYGIIEGDSASTTELYALLSAFARAPISQGIAATGSVDQCGNVQAIGGVNEKIKGFFDVCKQKGLTGDQGVIIPKSNIGHLMLDKEIVREVKEGNFHIWPVSRIEQGIERLTGMPYDSIFKEVKENLLSMSQKAKNFWKEKQE